MLDTQAAAVPFNHLHHQTLTTTTPHQGHNCTDYARWFASSAPYGPVCWTKDYEPWFIADRTLIPLYDSVFRGYGWNKVTQVTNTHHKGYVRREGVWVCLAGEQFCCCALCCAALSVKCHLAAMPSRRRSLLLLTTCPDTSCVLTSFLFLPLALHTTTSTTPLPPQQHHTTAFPSWSTPLVS